MIYICMYRTYVLPYTLHSNFTNSTKIASGHVGLGAIKSIANCPAVKLRAYRR